MRGRFVYEMKKDLILIVDYQFVIDSNNLMPSDF